MRFIRSVVVLLLWAAPSFAAVAFDAVADARSTSDTTCASSTSCTMTTGTVLSYSVTTGSNSNRQIATFVTYGCPTGQTAPTVSSVTYAGVSLSQILHVSPSAKLQGYLFALPAGTQPTSGANNVVVTISSAISACTATELNSGTITADGVNQTTTFTSSNTNSGDPTTNPTVTLSSSGANDLVVHGACGGSALSSPTGTSRWNNGNANTSCNEYGGATAAGGTVTLGWTMASDSWLSLAASFKDVTASTPAGTNAKKKKLGLTLQ